MRLGLPPRLIGVTYGLRSDLRPILRNDDKFVESDCVFTSVFGAWFEEMWGVSKEGIDCFLAPMALLFELLGLPLKQAQSE